jgi:signal transduction histidine kinase
MLIREGDETRPAPQDARTALPSAVPDGPADPAPRTARLLDAITTTGGLLCVVIGMTVMVAWLVRATAVLRFGSHDPMAFNTALALTVTGVALASRRPTAALVAGVFDAAVGLVILAEYALGRSLGIDQLVVKAYINGSASIPGRPAANTAVCCILAGAALLVWGPWRSRPRPIAAAAAGSLIGAIAVTASFGYVTGTPATYSWGHLTGMAFLTAGAMLILAISLLSAAWRDAPPGDGGLPKWLPLPAGVLALGLAAAVWLAIVGAGRITVDTSVGAATALSFLMAGLVALVVWLAQHADLRRRAALREVARRAEDETEIRALNATLARQVRHLEIANKNLQAFSYSIAHDLRTPLRAMSGFAEILAEEYSDRLDEAGRGYAGRIQAASTQMSGLIDDLLHMSRVSEAEIRLQEVDLSAEVKAICDQLRARAPGRRVRVTVEDGVRVTADAVLIRTALENLLENAWKFTARRADALIEFGTAPTEDASICCYVRDNGAGFDPAYVSKLFQQFQRLHTASEFAGTGIGLATVRRIIERHRGRVWAEGAIDRGATFYFALDAKDILNDSPILPREPIRSPPGQPPRWK